MSVDNYGYESFKRDVEIEKLSNRISQEYGIGKEKAKFFAKSFYNMGITVGTYSENQQTIDRFVTTSIKVHNKPQEEVLIKENIKSKSVDKEVFMRKAKKTLCTLGIASLILGGGLVATHIHNQGNAMDNIENKINYIAGVEYNIANENTYIVGYDENSWPETELNYIGVVDDIYEVHNESPELFDSTMFTIYNNTGNIGMEHQENTPGDEIRLNQFDHMENIFKELKSRDVQIDRIASCATFEDYVFMVIEESKVLSYEDLNELKSKFSEKYVDNKYVKQLAIEYYNAISAKNKVLNQEDERSR